MKKLLLIVLAVLAVSGFYGCQISYRPKLTQMQLDSIAKAQEDSIRIMQKAQDDSIAELSPKFKQIVDEFEDYTWIKHNTSPNYTNCNTIYLYFKKNADGRFKNLRLRIQYEADDWLFINRVVFNCDGENFIYLPLDMQSDLGHGRIWEWSDDLVITKHDTEIVYKIAKANQVKVKFKGSKYYATRTMDDEELRAFKETFEYYNLLRARQ